MTVACYYLAPAWKTILIIRFHRQWPAKAQARALAALRDSVHIIWSQSLSRNLIRGKTVTNKQHVSNILIKYTFPKPDHCLPRTVQCHLGGAADGRSRWQRGAGATDQAIPQHRLVACVASHGLAPGPISDRPLRVEWRPGLARNCEGPGGQAASTCIVGQGCLGAN